MNTMRQTNETQKPVAILELAQLELIERQARAMRGQAIGELIERFTTWVERAVWRARQRDYASFLSRATDHADLERRMKSLHQPSGPLAG